MDFLAVHLTGSLSKKEVPRMGEIARVNNIDVWWEDFGERSNTTILLIMGANANALYWDQKFIDELVKNLSLIHI